MVSGPERDGKSPATWFRRRLPRRTAAATRSRARPRRFANGRGVPERLGGRLLAMPRLDSKPIVPLGDFAIAIGQGVQSCGGFLVTKTTPGSLKVSHVIAKPL